MDKYLRHFDLFGANVHLQLHKGKLTHRTTFGGIVSLLIILLMATYTVVLSSIMYTYSNDRIMNKPIIQDVTARVLGKLRLSFLTQIQYHHPDGTIEGLKYNETTKQFIGVFYVQKSANYFESSSDKVEGKMDLEPCTV